MDTIPDINQLTGLGVGGVIAVFVVWLLNKSWKEHAQTRIDDAKAYSDKLLAFHELEKGRTDMLVGVIREVSVNITKNTVMTEAVHRRLDKENLEKG